MEIDDLLKHIIEIKEKASETHTLVKEVNETQKKESDKINKVETRITRVEESQKFSNKVLIAIPTGMTGLSALLWWLVR